MTSEGIPLSERAARELIAADAEFILDLVLNPRLEPIRPTAVLMLAPFTSAFLYESIRHTKLERPEALRELRSYQELLRASRMRMKLLNGDPKTLEGVLAEADELVANVKDLFMRDHRGMLGPLKRRLQKDLGVHFLQNEIVGTHHVALLNTGIPSGTLSALSWDTIGAYLRASGEAQGSDVVRVLSELGIAHELDIDAHRHMDTSGPPLASPQFRDLRSERFYGAMAQQAAPGRNGIGVVLTSILSQVNTARIIVPTVAGQNRVAAFKIRFVTLFHAALSLQWLLNKDRGNDLLHERTVQQIKAILADDAVRSVRKRRNHLFHYDLEGNTKKRIAPLFVPDLPLCGLVEAHAAGRSLTDVATEVGRGSTAPQKGSLACCPSRSPPRVRCRCLERLAPCLAPPVRVKEKPQCPPRSTN
jgi:hypothetical protein